MNAAPRLLSRRLPPAHRTFSILARSRQLLKSFEAHPMSRNSSTQVAQKGDVGRLMRHAFAPLVVYVPAMGLFLTWPLMAERALNGHVG